MHYIDAVEENEDETLLCVQRMTWMRSMDPGHVTTMKFLHVLSLSQADDDANNNDAAFASCSTNVIVNNLRTP